MVIKYTRNEELANSVTHVIGLFVVLSSNIYFLTHIPSSSSVAMYVIGISLYAFGGGLSYLASALYHSSPLLSKRREYLRRFDHAAIYCHIAGSYSPIMLSGMSERQEWGWLLFCIVWICAVVGSVISCRGLKEHSNVETICFVSMGLTLFIAFDKVLFCIGWHSMGWIIAEGVAFITGALFYSFNKIRYMHTVFHVFVLIGSLCHIKALYIILQ